MAYVLTSISGNLISAASAGMANSAFYDGTGRLISSLPDSATVSSIASSYAESAASGKLDSSSQVVTSTGSASAMMMGGTTYYASQINGLDISAQKAYVADEWMHAGSKLDATASAKFYTTANESGYVDSAYVSAIASSYAESAVSGKQDALEFAYDADSAISSINGSALAGQGGGASITAVSYDTATQQSSIVTATGFGIADSATNYPRVSSVYLTDGQTRHIEANTLAPGAAQTSNLYTLRFSPASSMWTTAGVAKGIYSPLQYGTGAGLFMDNGNFKGYLKGNELFICNTAIGRAARLEVHQNRGSRLGLTGNNGSSTVNLTESELTIVNSSYSTATFGRTKLEFKSSASGTATFSHNYIKLYDTAESAAKTISSTSIDYWNGKLDSSAIECDTASAITAIGGSAIAGGGGGGVDSATVSAIASSYVESGVSSKLDTTAFNSGDFYSTSNPSGFITGVDLTNYATTSYVDSSVSGKLDTTAYNSGDFYTTANESGYVGSAYVDSAVSGKMDSSALSSYVPYSSLEYNTASAISGINGSALAAGSTYSAGEGIDITDDVISVESPVDIVAGPGIVIDNPDGNTLRVSQYDPTVDVVRDCENWNGHTMKCIILRGAYTTNTSMQNQYIENVLPVGTTIAFIDGSNSYVVYGGNPQINMMVPYCIDNNRLFSPWVDITNRRVNLRYIDVSNNVTCTYYLCVKYAVD